MSDQSLVEKTNFFLNKLQNSSIISHEEAFELLPQLRKIIISHNKKYYQEDDPVISDADYDRLFNGLKQLEEKYPQLVTEDSPTQKIALKVEGPFQEVEHLAPMLSLDNAHSVEDLQDFENRIKRIVGDNVSPEYSVELKFDGIGIALIYENDELVRGTTRGDGTIGENITNNIKTIKSIPHTAHFSKKSIQKIEIRGEIIMPKKAFQKLNEAQEKEGKNPFANPRNAAAGSLRQLDASITASRDLDCFLYHISFLQGGRRIMTQQEALDLLQAVQLPINNEYKVCCSVEEMVSYIETIEAKRDEFPFEIDGLVIKVSNMELQEKLGYTMHHPRWAIAYKFKPRQEETVLKDITLQVGPNRCSHSSCRVRTNQYWGCHGEASQPL